jgi:DNA-binding phage protein
METLAGIEERFKKLRGVLDERSRRLVAAAESETMGRRGISAVSKATGVSRQVIRQGMAELKQGAVLPAKRVRRSGAAGRVRRR